MCQDAIRGIDELSDATRDMHLAHNRDEEKEHAAMVLEWIRRNDASFDAELKDYLFTNKSIAHKEHHSAPMSAL